MNIQKIDGKFKAVEDVDIGYLRKMSAELTKRLAGVNALIAQADAIEAQEKAEEPK